MNQFLKDKLYKIKEKLNMYIFIKNKIKLIMKSINIFKNNLKKIKSKLFRIKGKFNVNYVTKSNILMGSLSGLLSTDNVLLIQFLKKLNREFNSLFLKFFYIENIIKCL